MIPYYILKINYDKLERKYTLKNQIEISKNNEAISDSAKTYIEKINDYSIKNYHIYKYFYEKGVDEEIRVNNDKINFYFEIHKDNKIYINKTNDYLIFEGSKKSFLNFYNEFYKNNILDIKKMNVDYNKILDNRHNSNVTNMWIGNIKDINLRTANMIGSGVDDSEQCKKLLKEDGEITNLTIDYTPNSKSGNKRIMITDIGGIILYKKEKSIIDTLNLVLSAAKDLLD